jgi:hypothetical protein
MLPKHLWKVLYNDFLFRRDPLTSMAATGDFCFWLADFEKSSHLKPFGQMYRNLVHRCILQNVGTFGQAVSEEKIFKNRPIRNKNCLWWPCLLTDWNEMSNRNRGFSIDASYQVSVYFAKRPLKPLGQMIWNLVGSIYGRSFIKNAYSVPIH